MDKKANILFAFADDWGRYASAYAGDGGGSALCELIATPNFDRVAAEGVLFRNALVPAPSCTPCRSAILSGRYFWQTGLGAILAGARWDESIPSFPLELERGADYVIGHTYKVWSPGQTMNAPMGAGRTAYNSAGLDFNQFPHWVTAHAERFGRGEVGIDSAKQHLLSETRRNFQTFLRDPPSGRSFCYWWGPTNTHRTWERGSGQALWGIDPTSLKGRLPAFLPDVHAIREDAADYLGECQAVDAGLGVLLEELENIGELDNTLVVVSGDHGVPGMPRAKCNLYDIGCEVALAARWPGNIAPGRVIDDLVNLMDLGPTFCEVGGITEPSMTATSLVPLLTSSRSGQIDLKRDYVVTGRERHIAHARSGSLPYPQRGLREHKFLYIINFEPDRWPMGDPKGLDLPGAPTPTYETLVDDTMVVFRDMDGSPTKAWMIHHREEDDVEPLYELAFGKRPRQELYDLARDPDTMVNVADDPAYEDVCTRMEQRLLAILKRQADPRVMAQPCKFEYEPYAGPVDRAWFMNAATIAAIGPANPAPAASDPLPLPDLPDNGADSKYS